MSLETNDQSDVMLLISARECIRTHWLKHTYTDNHGRHCAVAALAVVCGNRRFRWPTRRERHLARLVARELPFNIVVCWMTGRARLAVFNDRCKTTRHDMLAVFDRTIWRLSQDERSEPAPGVVLPPIRDIAASFVIEPPSCKRSGERVHS